MIDLADWRRATTAERGAADYLPPPWVLERWAAFWSQVDKDVDRSRIFGGELAEHAMCWLWTGEITDRQPRFYAGEQWRTIWEVAWECYSPRSAELDRFPRPRRRCPDLCVRPTHLELQRTRQRVNDVTARDRLLLRQLAHPPNPAAAPMPEPDLAAKFGLSVHRVRDLLR